MLSERGVASLLRAVEIARRRASETMLVAVALRAEPPPRKRSAIRVAATVALQKTTDCEWVQNGERCFDRARYRVSSERRHYCRGHTRAHYRGEHPDA